MTELLEIDGTTTPGYESVRDVFAQRVDELGSGGGAFCAYVGGVPVVDLWAGSARPDVGWAEDTLAVLMSSTKGMTALVAQMLEAKGQLDIEAPVASYWPEFAQNGKEHVTVRHVLTHTAGLVGLPGHAEFITWDGDGWGSYDEIARRLESSTPAWEPGTGIGYHAITYGWLMGEIVFRITGRRVGVLFKEWIADPLGLDARIGTPASEHDRIAWVIDEDYSKIPAEMQPLLETYMAMLRDPSTLAGQAFMGTSDHSLLEKVETFARSPRVWQIELPAGNGTSTARSLAKMYAVLANGGEIDGVRLVPEESVRRWGAEQFRGWQQLAPIEMCQALGYHNNLAAQGGPAPFGPNPLAFGHGGMGGQIGCCDPDTGVAIGFVRNHLSSVSTLSADLIAAVYSAPA
jgi:CubicO group peptidase (beta-lactamase class C family)